MATAQMGSLARRVVVILTILAVLLSVKRRQAKMRMSHCSLCVLIYINTLLNGVTGFPIYLVVAKITREAPLNN